MSFQPADFHLNKHYSLPYILRSTKCLISSTTSYNQYVHRVSELSPDVTSGGRTSRNIPLIKIYKYPSSQVSSSPFKSPFHMKSSSIPKKENEKNENDTIYNYRYQKKNEILFPLPSFSLSMKSSLAQDFLGKWEKCENLKYDENEIFHKESYMNKVIKEKIDQIKSSPIDNTTTNLATNLFNDNGDEIKLKLNPMKLIFKINKGEENNNKADNNPESNNTEKVERLTFAKKKEKTPIVKKEKDYVEIEIPFSYIFLFYYKDFEFFKDILVATIKFDKSFKQISFDEKEIYNFIIKEDTKEKYDKKPDKYSPKAAEESEKSNKKNANDLLEKVYNTVKIKMEDKFGKKQNKKRIVVVESSESNKNKFIHNTYKFQWLTPTINYNCELILPKISFNYLKYNKIINVFINRDLYLYLWINNFMYWDYYIINYLFSLRNFRFVIENLSSKISLKSIKINKMTNELIRPKQVYSNLLNSDYYEDEEEINKKQNKDNLQPIDLTNKVIELSINKIYEFNKNDLNYTFFYTNSDLENYIYQIYSYSIYAECDRLNFYKKWKFILDFKQMKFLDDVTKYEKLTNFLPKIIKTDYENKLIDLDYSVFKDFDYNILNYKKFSFNLADYYMKELFDDVNSPRKKIKIESLYKISKDFIEKKPDLNDIEGIDARNTMQNTDKNNCWFVKKNSVYKNLNIYSNKLKVDYDFPYLKIFKYNDFIKDVPPCYYNLNIKLSSKLDNIQTSKWPQIILNNEEQLIRDKEKEERGDANFYNTPSVGKIKLMQIRKNLKISDECKEIKEKKNEEDKDKKEFSILKAVQMISNNLKK